MNDIDLKQIVVVNGEPRIPLEVFKASGILWVRYKRGDGSNGYATIAEWRAWTLQGTTLNIDNE